MAPMLSLEKVSRKGINPIIRPLANLLSWLVPTAAIVATERNTLYHDIQASYISTLQNTTCQCCKMHVRTASAGLVLFGMRNNCEEGLASAAKFHMNCPPTPPTTCLAPDMNWARPPPPPGLPRPRHRRISTHAVAWPDWCRLNGTTTRWLVTLM